MYWIGVDHHKRNSYVTSLDDDRNVLVRRNLSAKAEALEAFFRDHPRPFVVGIEATYAWEYVADIVEALGEKICVAHPLLLKAFARRHKKNDKIDSALIVRLLRRGDLPVIAHPPKRARQQRDVYRQRMDLVHHRTAVSCRAKAFADRLGFHATMNLSTEKGVAALAALGVAPASEEVLSSFVAQLRFLHSEIKRFEKIVDELAEATAETRWLQSIPGVGPYLALLIAAEVFDVSRFANTARFVSYAGVAPGAFASGGRVFAGHLCRNVNKYLRWAFTETVYHYIRACPSARKQYERLCAKKGWKTARLAVARKVAAIAYCLMRDRRPFRPVNEQTATARNGSL